MDLVTNFVLIFLVVLPFLVGLYNMFFIFKVKYEKWKILLFELLVFVYIIIIFIIDKNFINVNKIHFYLVDFLSKMGLNDFLIDVIDESVAFGKFILSVACLLYLGKFLKIYNPPHEIIWRCIFISMVPILLCTFIFYVS